MLALFIIGGAFILFYDDHNTWAKGGNSLSDWDIFSNGIMGNKISVDNLKKAFSNLYEAVKNNAIPTLKGYAEIFETWHVETLLVQPIKPDR